VIVGVGFGPASPVSVRDQALALRAKWTPVIEADRTGTLDLKALSEQDQPIWQNGRLLDNPFLLVHGAADVDTRPEHSHRVFRALRARKQLMIVPGARHNASLHPDVWPAVENWIDQAILDEVAVERRIIKMR
jgi:pimeloyl-ACP methyl ester carboxylesterase